MSDTEARPPPADRDLVRDGAGATGELFDAEARELARRQHADSHYRWLTLSSDADAAALRRALQACWALAGNSRPTLRQGLAHERWGQHVGALAQLLALGWWQRQGLQVESEPQLAGQRPDLLVSHGTHQALVEVRSLAGCGRRPWEAAAAGDAAPTADLAGADAGPPPGQPRSRRHERDRDRRRARDRAEARAALDRALADSLARVLSTKARAYRELCTSSDLPYVICLYQDTDTQIAERVLEWAFGPAPAGAPRQPAGGALHAEAELFEHLSAVLVLGRVEIADEWPAALGSADPCPSAAERTTPDDRTGTLQLRGELILNPLARRPLPTTLRPTAVRLFAADDDGPLLWDRKAAPRLTL